MKMYQIEPNDWNIGWCVMANSPEEALQFLKCYLKKDDDFDKWENATVDNLPDKYYIKEYNEGEIMEYENS
jgi:hypothetical protein